MKAYSADLRTKVVDSVKRGISKTETARRFGLNRSTVNRYLKRLAEEGSLAPKRAPASVRSWDQALCGCSKTTAKLGHGSSIGKDASSSL